MSSKSVDAQDRSRGAWTVLFAVSLTNVFTYGFSTSFGVFREYYFRTPPYIGSQEVAYVGPLGLGLIQGLTPFLIHFCAKKPHLIHHLMWLGAMIMVVSSIGAAYATNPLQLIMTLGLLYGIGGGCIFAPSIALIDEWFLERRTLANGLFFSVSSLAPASLSPIFAVTLQRYSSRTTLLGWAVACAVLSCIALPCARRRHSPGHKVEDSSQAEELESGTSSPPAHLNDEIGVSECMPSLRTNERAGQQLDADKATYKKPQKFWTTWVFWLVCLATIAQGLAHFLPALYIPSYAADLGVSEAKASVLITAFQITSMISQPCYGALVDRAGPLFPVIATSWVASLSILLCWGLAHTYWPLVLFMILCGGTSGAFVVFRSSFATCIVAAAAAGTHEAVVNKSNEKVENTSIDASVVEKGPDATTVTATNRVSEDDTRATESLISGILMSIRGVATVCSGLIGKAIVASSQDAPLRTDEYAEGRWKNLVIFTGVTMAVASVGSLAATKWPKRRV